MYRETRNVHNASDGRYYMVLMARINPRVLADNNSPLTAADFYLGNGVCNIRELHVDGEVGLVEGGRGSGERGRRGATPDRFNLFRWSSDSFPGGNAPDTFRPEHAGRKPCTLGSYRFSVVNF